MFNDDITKEISKAAQEVFAKSTMGDSVLPQKMIDAATELRDLRSPPGNHLEKLSGNREGQWSIRINKRWRICFEWQGGAAWNVEIVDYHK